MPQLILFNKPFNVLSQFTDNDKRRTLAEFIKIEGIYAAGRLDYDSEGLLLLTDHGPLQHKITDPKHKLAKTYWAQVEGEPSESDIKLLEDGVKLKDGITAPAKAKIIPEPTIWDRTPPIRERKNINTTWISLTITEGKNRQVRRMTAAIGFPTLRLIRYSIGNWTIDNLEPGSFNETSVNMPKRLKKQDDLDTPRHGRRRGRKRR